MDKNPSKEFDQIIKGLFKKSSREKCLNVYSLSTIFIIKDDLSKNYSITSVDINQLLQ